MSQFEKKNTNIDYFRFFFHLFGIPLKFIAIAKKNIETKIIFSVLFSIMFFELSMRPWTLGLQGSDRIPLGSLQYIGDLTALLLELLTKPSR